MMDCPKCQSDRITNAGLNRSGTQRYQCLACKQRFTPQAKKAGRKVTGEAMTGAERNREWRSRLKKKQQEQE